jgi:group I intron endonuclease
MIGIYKITNIINQKIYIGQSTNIEKRTKAHFTHPQNRYLSMSIDKYGAQNFTIEVVKEIHPSPIQGLLLDLYEEHFIQKYDTMNRDKGYNLMHGGYPGRLCEESKELLKKNCAGKLKGRTHTKETIERMRKAQSNRSEEWKRKNAEARRNGSYTTSEETKQKIREARAHQVITEDTKQKLSEAMKGKKKTPEHIAKVAKAFKEWLQTPDGIAYLQEASEKMKNRTITEKTRAKMSASAKKRKTSEATKKKLSEINKGRKFTDEHRAKIKQAMQKRIESGAMSKPRKPLSEETKAKISQKRKDYYKRLRELAEDDPIF